MGVTVTNLATQADATALVLNGAPQVVNNTAVGMTLQDGSAGQQFLIDTEITDISGDQYEDKSTLTILGSPLDLTTLDAVKRRAEVSSTVDDGEIQAAITGFSEHILQQSGVSSLNSVVPLDEFYDGKGTNRLFLRSFPVMNVSAVNMCGVSIPASGSWNQWGVVIDQSRKSISLRGGIGNFSTFPYPNAYTSPWGYGRGPVFMRGIQNIEVVYSAGYQGTPNDLEYAVRCIVAINYKRKAWQDQQSRSVSAQGSASTTRYRDWQWPPEYQYVLEYYQRKAIIY